LLLQAITPFVKWRFKTGFLCGIFDSWDDYVSSLSEPVVKWSVMEQENDLLIRELLRDLGWLPSDLNCDEKKYLADEYLNATMAWIEISRGQWLRLLRQAYKTSPQGKYETLATTAIENARVEAARTRLALQAHVAAHNC
jgi:hypothetical protein